MGRNEAEMDAILLLQEVSKRDGVGGRIADTLKEAAHLVGDDFIDLERALLEICDQAPGKLVSVCRHIVDSGGKYIRPMLCLLAYRAVGGNGTLPSDLAVTCELLHNATLLHDDVIDEGDKRRGRSAVRVVYGNALSVLGGDFLLVKTVEMVSLRGTPFMGPFVTTLKQLVEGELAQLQRRGSIETTEAEYFRIIEGKTASLFRWAVHSGALAGGADDALLEAIGRFGWHVGIAFQLMDDLLDFTADAALLGKNLLSDINEGKMTLPLILAARESADLRCLLQALVEGETPQRVAPQVLNIIHSAGIVDEVSACAARHTSMGLEALRDPGTVDPEIMRVLTELSSALLKRDF